MRPPNITPQLLDPDCPAHALKSEMSLDGEPEVARSGSGTETPQPRVEVAQPGRKPSADGLELMGPETADVAQEYGENGAAAEMLIRPKEAHHSRAAYRVGMLQ